MMDSHANMIKKTWRMVQIAFLQLVTCLSIVSSAIAQNLLWIDPPPGFDGSAAIGISADGNTVLYTVWDSSFTTTQTILWYRSQSLQVPISDSAWSNITGFAISDDGSTVVGSGYFDDTQQAFHYVNDTIYALGTLGGFLSIALDVSADGSVIVGYSLDSSWTQLPFVWTAEKGMLQLQPPPNFRAIQGSAYAVSPDGRTIVGDVLTEEKSYAVVWENTIPAALPLTRPWIHASARSISPDGMIIAGVAADSLGRVFACYWRKEQSVWRFVDTLGNLDSATGTEAVIITPLPWLSPPAYQIFGRMVYQEGQPTHAFRWTQPLGMEDLNVTFENLLQPQSLLGYVHDGTSDGKYIVGSGINGITNREEGFILEVGNLPPTAPELASPRNGVLAPYPLFTMQATDPENDSLRYIIEIRGSSGSRFDTTRWYASNQWTAHTLFDSLQFEKFQWRARAEDRKGARSKWSNWIDILRIPGVKIESTDKIRFQQVHFVFSEIEEPFSTWGRMSLDESVLFSGLEMKSGFLNVYTDLGWVIQNFRVMEERAEIATYFQITDSSGLSIDSLRCFIVVSPEPLDTFPDGGRTTFPVSRILWSAEGVGEGTDSIPDPPPPAAVKFNPQEKTWGYIQDTVGIVNEQTATNQCFPMAIANSLEYLRRRYGLRIPHPHKPGLRGDSTIVGWLDSLSDRFAPRRNSGRGVWFQPMLRGKFAYLKMIGLSNALIHKHQGRGWGDPNQGQALPDGDFTSSGITSRDAGNTVTWQWLCDELRKGEDVEIAWKHPAGGGHVVRLIGCGQTAGQPWIEYAHDRAQTHADPMDTTGLERVREYVSDPDGDGVPNLGGSNGREILFALSESFNPESSTEENSYGMLSFTIAPSPASERVLIQFQLDNRQFVTLRITDYLGRTVAVLLRNMHNPGEYVIPFDVSSVPAGIYLVELRIGAERYLKPLSVVR